MPFLQVRGKIWRGEVWLLGRAGVSRSRQPLSGRAYVKSVDVIETQGKIPARRLSGGTWKQVWRSEGRGCALAHRGQFTGLLLHNQGDKPRAHRGGG